MRFKTWPVAALGLASLLVLTVMATRAASRQAQEIYRQIDQLNGYHNMVDRKLRQLRSDVHLSSIFIRDSLLDVSSERASEYRQRLAEFRRTSTATIGELRAVAGQHEGRINSLQGQLEEYWRAFEPLFDWTPTEKILKSAAFLRREVVPLRERVLALAAEVEALNEANLEEERGEAERRHADFQAGLTQLLWQTLSLGLAVALVAVYRLRSLERRADEQRAEAERTGQQMRELSQRLVATQEEERRNLSRELHDHVAQVLTALRMEIGRLDRSRVTTDDRLTTSIVECRRLVDRMFRTVRDLAMGLRPSMLDDFGLKAALEWLVRDSMTRFDLSVQLAVDGDVDGLPDPHRTCAYRAVQEALTNCARHAAARAVTIRIAGGAYGLSVTVSDDGVGIDPDRRRAGLGLRGLDERVKELGGTLEIFRRPAGGTTVRVELPLSPGRKDVSLASTAG